MMLEIRWHGRGGQGAVTAAELLAKAAIAEGLWAQAFPAFGPERRGAPVLAFTRISDNPIKMRVQVYEPDVVVVLDPSLIGVVDVGEGLKQGGVAIVNSAKDPVEFKEVFPSASKIFSVDATKIALEELKVPIVNTAMLGAAARAIGAVPLERVEEAIRERFGTHIGERNVRAVRRAHKEVRLWESG